MKKLFMIVPALLLSALILCTTAYAEETADPQNQQDQQEQEQPEQPGGEGDVQDTTKKVTGIALSEGEPDRFVKLGESPDLTGTKYTVTYYDGSTETVGFEQSFLTDWQKDKKGRVGATLTIKQAEHTEYFIVYDESIDALRFEDVTKSYWGYKQIRRGAQAGFFEGMSETEFGVAYGMTRAQFCQMIYNIYRDDKTVFTRHKQASFTDVQVGAWYHNAVIACAESGIVSGMGDGTFMPDSYITRQDVAVIMMSVLMGDDEVKSLDLKATVAAARKNGIAAKDFKTTSPYAYNYVAAALGVIYEGDENGNINPHANITRAECAAMCYNYFFDGFAEPQPKRLVYLSPSNQNSNAYAIYDAKDEVKKTYTEGLQMQEVGDLVAEKLEKMGYEVYIADVELSIRGDDSRPVEANNMGADCYVAIHSNGAPKKNDGSYQGTTCYYNGDNKGAKELSAAIYKYMSELTPTKDRGSLNDMLTSQPFTEVKNPTMANVLLEVEFHDYATYAQWIVDNKDAIATAIANGINDYLLTLE